MDEVLEAPAAPFVSRGGTSIRSFKFHERMTSSSPPSIGGDSTRRRAFGMSSLLGRRAKNQPPPVLNTLILAEKLRDAELCEPSENVDPASRSKIPSQVTASPSSASTNKQSSSIFRKLTTKFNRNRARSSSPPPSDGANRRRSIVGPQPNSAWALQEARNAALRERGLLPPLPLSVQEAQQDSRIAIVSPEPGQESGLERRQTAANRVKEEWEAKNRERMAEFRFGGDSSSASLGLEAVKEVDTPLPTPLPSPDEQDSSSQFGAVVDVPEPKAPRAPPPTLNLSREHRLSPPLMQAWSDAPPDPCFFPLPPSPTPGSATESNFASLISAFAVTPAVDAGFTPMSPSFFPLPPSPSFSNPSFHSTIQDGTETPRVGGDCTPKPPQSPTATSMDESLLTPPSRSQSIPRMDASESESSLGVPSLVDSESQTSMSTSDSLVSFGRMRNVPVASTVRNSTIEPLGPAHHAISVIVESPIEERDGGIVLSASPVDEEPQQKAVPEPSQQAQAQVLVPQRRTTEPTSQPAERVDRRKSLNVFKNMSLRRFGRTTKSTTGPPAGFDPSLLPPSPTLPATFTTQQQHHPQIRGRLAAPSVPQAHRNSASPTMHNDGTICSEMSKIENEESRRMTEVAFM